MHIIIKKVKILDRNSSHAGKTTDIYIKGGIIQKIGRNLTARSAKVLEFENAHASIGWFDIGTQIGEPGFEHRETIESVSAAAAKGGYTGIACFPNTSPVIQSKSEIEYIKTKSASSLIDFHPIGAVSRDTRGTDLTEMIDMHHHGAIAFSDGNHYEDNDGLLLRALKYVKSFDGLIINPPFKQLLSLNGQMHEGEISTSLGMVGIPRIAEEIALHRDINLLKYTKSKLLSHTLSTAAAVNLIRKAKEKKLRIFASVSAYSLGFTDSDIQGFDPNLKVLPPFREQHDAKALIKGIADNTIDCICSNHVPLEEEAKKLEYPYAEFGAIGLETCFPFLNNISSRSLSLQRIIDKLAYGPRQILNIPIPTIKKGAKANITIFNPKAEWTYQLSDIASKSKNSPVIGKKLKGKIYMVINGEAGKINE